MEDVGNSSTSESYSYSRSSIPSSSTFGLRRKTPQYQNSNANYSQPRLNFDSNVPSFSSSFNPPSRFEPPPHSAPLSMQTSSSYESSPFFQPNQMSR